MTAMPRSLTEEFEAGHMTGAVSFMSQQRQYQASGSPSTISFGGRARL